jgi:hypothetical protein
MTVSGATIQYGSGSVPTTLNSTARIPGIDNGLEILEIHGTFEFFCEFPRQNTHLLEQ